jgi:perosamine synthetase
MIPITKPLLGEEEAKAAGEAILSGWVTQGPRTKEFEEAFAQYTGAPHACAVSSCTTALHLALLSLGVGPGHEVITVSHSFIAAANTVRYCGAKPVFVDIEPETLNLDPKMIEPVISSRTRAILCVHQVGMPCDLSAILDLGRKHCLPVIEDAACAIGSEILWQGKWERIGRPHGDIACFSFHPRKLITTGDGGMLTTRNPEWDRQFRLLRQHGMSVPDTVRHTSKQVVFEHYPVMGYNYRLTDIQAAVGVEQLKRLPQILPRRRSLANRYLTLLSSVPSVGLPKEPAWARSNWQSFWVRLPVGCNQSEVMQIMLDRGVATRRGIMCAHREGAFKDEDWFCGERRETCRCLSHTCRKLLKSEQAQDQCLLLPLYPQMNEGDQDRIVEALHEACAQAAQL